ncbi:hypothetical protein [Nodosilinea sp. E11]|uniref:HpsJ-like protein, cyanoexosortase C-associated n=1 Tax=Nodosilinea sp. E11 TaxID=3037479 RepID=UPI0029342EB5|nr:hypothetical protein [Nodosilinea sp. E11]WOD39256.1 hypothetical protein RRF56_23905 [Nodosilinea sp. E11]
MANIPVRKGGSQALYSSGQSLSIIVGLACLTGFLVDVAILAVPLDPLDLQWRISLLQQVGDRGIVLLFGLSLLTYGLLNNRSWRKQLALLCLLLGVGFSLSGILVVRDTLKFQTMTLTTITHQQAQVRTQIETARANPAAVSPDLTPEALQQAAQLLDERVNMAKQNTRTGMLKVGAGSIGNLVVLGIALIAVGRFGSQVGR